MESGDTWKGNDATVPWGLDLTFLRRVPFQGHVWPTGTLVSVVIAKRLSHVIGVRESHLVDLSLAFLPRNRPSFSSPSATSASLTIA